MRDSFVVPYGYSNRCLKTQRCVYPVGEAFRLPQLAIVFMTAFGFTETPAITGRETRPLQDHSQPQKALM